jgi:hypothetical protein
MCLVHASSETPPKTQWEKRVGEKSALHRASYIALVASLKTLHEKT